MKPLVTIVLLALPVLGGCGRRTLFSEWREQGFQTTLNLSEASFYKDTGQPSGITWKKRNGILCACSLILYGGEAAAAAIVSDCTYLAGEDKDKSCNLFNATYHLTNDGGTLSVCEATGSGCGTYD